MANLFYVREAHGFTRHRQVNAAKARGVPDQLVWVEGRTETETLNNLLDHGLRSGDTLEVWRLAVLAEPRKRKGDPLPRKRLADAIKRLASSSIILHEVESNRVFNATDVAADMIFDALDHLSSARPSRKRGRAKLERPEPALYNAAKAVWLNTRDFSTNDEALSELQTKPEVYGGPWTRNRCFKEFGASNRRSPGRPRKVVK